MSLSDKDAPRGTSRTYDSYRILSSTSPFDLEKTVNACVNAGWVPLGGVAVTANVETTGSARDETVSVESYQTWAQAMVRP